MGGHCSPCDGVARRSQTLCSGRLPGESCRNQPYRGHRHKKRHPPTAPPLPVARPHLRHGRVCCPGYPRLTSLLEVDARQEPGKTRMGYRMSAGEGARGVADRAVGHDEGCGGGQERGRRDIERSPQHCFRGRGRLAVALSSLPGLRLPPSPAFVSSFSQRAGRIAWRLGRRLSISPLASFQSLRSRAQRVWDGAREVGTTECMLLAQLKISPHPRPLGPTLATLARGRDGAWRGTLSINARNQATGPGLRERFREPVVASTTSRPASAR